MLLHEHWIEYVSKFNEYIFEVQRNKEIYQNLEFRLPNAIVPCIPIRDAMNSNVRFNLRYLERKIAEISGVDVRNQPKLDFRPCVNALVNMGYQIHDIKEEYSWNDPECQRFRSFFKNLISNSIKNDIDYNNEATIQTALWKLLKNCKKENGNLRNIQPICMFNRFFEPPAFLKASNVHKSGVVHSKNSGNIDMIARIGKGKNSELAVIELKKISNARPEDVILQAIVYAVCIKKLLFCNDSNNAANKWWKLFGYGQSDQEDFSIPKKFVMHAVACMPYKEGIDKSFVLSEPLELGNGVSLFLDYLYFDFDRRNLNSISFQRENVSINKVEIA
jgi:hypothetical protein